MAERQQERFQQMQTMMQWRLVSCTCELLDNLELTPIVSIFIAPREILIDKNKPYIYIAFDYFPSRDERLIVKISEKYYTSHFGELISRN